jgi:hypothetical protein
LIQKSKDSRVTSPICIPGGISISISWIGRAIGMGRIEYCAHEHFAPAGTAQGSEGTAKDGDGSDRIGSCSRRGEKVKPEKCGEIAIN